MELLLELPAKGEGRKARRGITLKAEEGTFLDTLGAGEGDRFGTVMLPHQEINQQYPSQFNIHPISPINSIS